MKRFRLNLAALRENLLPPSRQPFELEEIVGRQRHLDLSRRQMLALAGGAGVAASSGIASMRGILAGSFEVRERPGRVALHLGGKECWTIETRRFAGDPKLTVQRIERAVRIELRDAFYPGTDIPADLVCEIRPGLLRRSMDLRMTFGGFSATLPLERWLLGAEPARSRVTIAPQACRFDGASALTLGGTAHAAFAPDWRLDLAGDGVAALAGFGGEALADHAQLILPAEDAPSLIDARTRRRTVIALDRGSREWAIDPGARDFGSWTFEVPGATFDSVRGEFADVRGRRAAAMVAESAVGAPTLSARPHAGLTDPAGAPFGFALSGARYAVAFDGGRRHAALVADQGTDAGWMHVGGMSLLVGRDEADASVVELVGRDGALIAQSVRPALLATFIPVAGSAISRPVRTDPGTRVELLHAVKRTDAALLQNRILFNPADPDEPPVVVASKSAIALIRPEDLVVLIIQFEGMEFSAAGGKGGGFKRTGGDARMIVWMQPQGIAEEAFFETATGYPTAKGNPNDPDKANDGADGSPAVPAPYAPPVQSRMHGPSRIAFDIPAGTDMIPASLEVLLALCGQLPMHVAPHALPPKGSDWYLSALALVPTGVMKYGGNTFQLQLDAMKTGGSGGLAMRKVTKASMTRSQKLIVASRAQVYKTQVAGSDLQLTMVDADIDKAIGVVVAAQPDPRPEIRAPWLNETAIEMPYRLIVSPNRLGAWAHATKPVYGLRTGRVELWHTRLGVRAGKGVDEIEPRVRTLRAIWALDITPGMSMPLHKNSPFRMSLDAFDRVNIVQLSSNYGLTRPPMRTPYDPLPIAVERFMLSSLGSWMNTRGAWPRETMPAGLSVEEWRHRATMGRDHYVRVVYAGLLFPFGHFASLIKVTERKMQPHPGNPSVKVAYMRQRMFIVVREPEKDFRVSNLKMKDLVTGMTDVNIDLQMPLSSVRITTLVTPNLDVPESSDYFSRKQSAFWPRVGGNDFQFHVVMRDVGGNTVETTLPLIFLGKEENDRSWSDTIVDDIALEYEKPANLSRRKRPLNGQRVAYTESVKPGDSLFETDAITFGVQVPQADAYNNIPSQRPRFFPVVRKADLRLPVAKHMTGNNAPTSVEFADVFLRNGMAGGNPGQVFLKMLPGANVKLDFNGQGNKSGGLMKPNMNISAISLLSGPVAGDNAVEKFGGSGKFNPEDFFKGFGGIPAKLFGVIDLWDLLDEIGLDQADLIPKFVTQALDAIEGFVHDIEIFLGYVDEVKKAGGTIATVVTNLKNDIDAILAAQDHLEDFPGAVNAFIGHLNGLPAGHISIPAVASMQDAVRREAEKMLNRFRELVNSGAEFLDAVQSFVKAIEMVKEMKVKFEWKPKLKSWGFDAGHPLFIANNDGVPAYFLISVEVRAKTDGKTQASVDVICSLENFTLDLIAPASFIKLYFNKVQFLAAAGKKPEVNVELKKIEFVGVLSFIEALRSLIPLDGFSDPPGIDVSAEGIRAYYSVTLPNIAFGVFSLQNISLGAGFTIPFIGEPLSVNFNFCTRENPFLLTVSMIGGGGFFGITLDPGGIQLLEAAFEFGASLALDFGVASGEVHIMAGIYFKMVGKDCSLTGYLRIGGSVDVLGLITASIELRMELTYEFASGKCVGRATLTVEVEVLFFSASVEISCERKFAGSNGDPSFRELMDSDGPWSPWNEYCDAFA